MTTPRVVAAVTSDVRRRISAILTQCDLRFVGAGSELVQALDAARCDLMIVEVHFNESSAAAALRCVLAREERFPVVCVREVESDRPGYAVLGALRMAAGVGAQAFVDLLDYPDDEAGNAGARAVLQGFLKI